MLRWAWTTALRVIVAFVFLKRAYYRGVAIGDRVGWWRGWEQGREHGRWIRDVELRR